MVKCWSGFLLGIVLTVMMIIPFCCSMLNPLTMFLRNCYDIISSAVRGFFWQTPLPVAAASWGIHFYGVTLREWPWESYLAREKKINSLAKDDKINFYRSERIPEQKKNVITTSVECCEVCWRGNELTWTNDWLASLQLK